MCLLHSVVVLRNAEREYEYTFVWTGLRWCSATSYCHQRVGVTYLAGMIRDMSLDRNPMVWNPDDPGSVESIHQPSIPKEKSPLEIFPINVTSLGIVGIIGSTPEGYSWFGQASSPIVAMYRRASACLWLHLPILFCSRTKEGSDGNNQVHSDDEYH